MKLNIGSGYKRYEGFTNVDADPLCEPDIILNIDDVNLKIPLEDNTVTEIVAEHVLEHIGDGFFKLLQELYRVSVPGAIIHVKVPHPFHEAYLADPTHKRPILVETFRLFDKEHNRESIATGGRASTLGLQYDVDFKIVHYEYSHDPYYEEIKKWSSQEQLERIFRSETNTTLEIYIVLQVNK